MKTRVSPPTLSRTRKSPAFVEATGSLGAARWPDGLPGNDDSGQMSAWYVFSAMAFYRVDPGTPTYAIGSPFYARVTIHLPNGKKFALTADNQGPQNLYIQRQTLSGVPLKGFLITHSDIVSGAMLHFVMGPQPKLTSGAR